jgi:hypothetical protein
MAKTKDLPKPVQAALDSYAYYSAQREHGYGNSVDKAEKSWLKSRKALVRWLNRNKT